MGLDLLLSPPVSGRRYLEILLGAFLITSGPTAVMRALSEGGLATPTLAMATINVTAGALFLLRDTARAEAHGAVVAMILPTVALPALALGVAPPPASWSALAQWVFVVGAIGAVASLAALGKSFAIFPALREVVVRGPYRWLRHPVYLSELVMVAATLLASSGPVVPAVGLPLLLAAVVFRIVLEERLLCQASEYAEYRGTVRWRLFPGIW